MQIFNYTKNNDANILIKINSNNNIVNSNNKDIILEVFKGISIIKDDILYINYFLIRIDII